ncbi:hypothetical protein ACFE04_027452 [Oxalis oulophora]
MATHSLSLILPTIPISLNTKHKTSSLSLSFTLSPLYGNKLIINQSNRFVLNSQSSTSSTITISAGLPTPKPDGVSPDKIPNWSARSIKTFALAELEARNLKYPNTGTEALLMGILVEGDGGEITPANILLGIWSEKDSAGHKLLANMGFNDEKAKELAKSMNDEVVWKKK